MLPGLVKRQTINSCDYMPFVIYLFFLRNELGKVLPQFTVSEVLEHVFLMAARLRRQVEVLLQRPYPRCGPPGQLQHGKQLYYPGFLVELTVLGIACRLCLCVLPDKLLHL